MKYSEAFAALGYQLEIPRQDWSAENDDGVCLSLWQSELKYKNGSAFIDTRKDCLELSIWRDKPGNKKRIRHLKRAIDQFDDCIDVVIVQGTPGEGITSAAPWLIEQRRNAGWRIKEIDENTGHFSAETVARTAP